MIIYDHDCTCLCKPGYKQQGGKCNLEETPYLMVMKGGHIIDISLKSEEQKASRFLTPIVGVENGLQLDNDRNKECIFWVEAVTKDSENGTIYTMGIGQLDGYLYWLDDGGIAVSAKVGKPNSRIGRPTMKPRC
ncbi:hypothetical protein Pmani_015317 [Petrolisthes manimaculis]|uniref:Uncharacterized protein n=1 Tax=Petrolisthes manimaculis TaxID=1843537 RepID=A0AAE1PS65_9EUCA|nr:hypothetical protein Pmani_015317 [Petrolisthes manimaculis]